MGDGGEPDWAFWVEDGPPSALTDEQATLLAELERIVSSFGTQPPEPDAFIRAVTPVLAALRDSGLSAKRIADNSRIRPEAVERLLA